MSLIPSPQEVLAQAQSSVPSEALPTPASVLRTAQRSTSTEPNASFGSSLFKSVGGFISSAASKVKSFYTQETQNFQDVGAGRLQVTPDDLLASTKSTFSALGSGALSIVKGFNQGIVRIGESALQTVAPDLTKKIIGSNKVQVFAKDITGEATTPSYQDIYHASRNYALEKNASAHEASLFGGLAVVGALFADNPLFGPEGAAFKLSEQGIKDLTIAATDDAVKAILKRESPHLSPTQLDAITPVFRSATDENQVRSLADSITQASHAPVKGAPPGALPAPEELLSKAQQVTPHPEDVLSTIGLSPNEAFLKSEKQVPVGTFGDTQFVVGSYGRNAIERKIVAGKEDRLSVDEVAHTIPYVTDGYRAGDSPFRTDNVVFVAKMPNGETRAVITRLNASKQEEVINAFRVGKDPQVFIDNLKTFGAPAGSRTRILSLERSTPSPLADRSSITIPKPDTNTSVLPTGGAKTIVPDLAAAAEKGSAERAIVQPYVPGEARQFSPNLLKAIAEENLPGPINDLLGVSFPKLSEHTRDLFAAKLAGMKRTPDIEGVIRMLSSTDGALAETARIIQAGKSIEEKKALAAALDRGTASALTPAQIDKQIMLVSKTLLSKEETALAQQEYDLLWEHASQPVLDHFAEVKMARSFMRDTLGDHPAAELYTTFYRRLGRDVGDPTYQLQDVMNTAQRLKREGKPLAKYQEDALRLDTKIHELGFKDFGAAQDAVTAYKKMLEHEAALTAEIRTLEPQARAVRMLQPMMDDVPVIARAEVGAIDVLAHPDLIRSDYRDISGFTGQFRDLSRNAAAFFGKHWDVAKKTIFDPFDAAKGAYIDEIKGLGDEIEKNIITKYGIQRGSKESKAIMDYGEREIAKYERVPGMSFEYTSPEGLAKAFGQKRAEDIIHAESWLQHKYNQIIDQANEARAKIYPNNPSKLIPKRKDYFRHFQDQGGIFKQVVDLFESPAGIDPNLSGLSEWTKPKSKFLSFAQERVGQGSERDAIGGFLDYAPSFAYMKHIDPQIGKFRYLRRKLAENAPTPGPTEYRDIPVHPVGYKGTDQLALTGGAVKTREQGINHFLKYLDDVANDLAGKTNPMDRYLQDTVPGGRATFRAINFVNSRIKANTILGNLSSAVAQAFNLPQGIASAGRYTVRGIDKTLASIFVKSEDLAKSVFIKERYTQPLTSRFKIDWLEHPVRGTTERTRDFAVWITQALDEAATKLTWHSHNEMAKDMLTKSVDGSFAFNGVRYTDPVKFADDLTRSLVAGRGIGEVALVQKSKIFQIFAPFQVENVNAFWQMGGWMKNKQFGTIASFLVASYLMNEAAKHIRGSRVIFDPINSAIQGGTDAWNELQDSTGTPGRAAGIFLGRQVGEALSNVPFGDTFSAALPDAWLKGIGFPGGKQEVFGQGNPGRFGGSILLASGWSNFLFQIAPPFAGGQIQKSIGGLQAMLTGGVDSSTSGKLNFKVNPSPLLVAQAIAFGKNASPEAQKFFAQRDDLFMRSYRYAQQASEISVQAEGEWQKAKDMAKKDGKAAAVTYLANLSKTNPQLSDAIKGVAQSEAQGLTGVDRMISMMGVTSGERAKYIQLQVKSMDTRQAQISFLQNLSDKKLISKQVFEQLQILLPSVIKPKANATSSKNSVSLLPAGMRPNEIDWVNDQTPAVAKNAAEQKLIDNAKKNGDFMTRDANGDLNARPNYPIGWDAEQAYSRTHHGSVLA